MTTNNDELYFEALATLRFDDNLFENVVELLRKSEIIENWEVFEIDSVCDVCDVLDLFNKNALSVDDAEFMRLCNALR